MTILVLSNTESDGSLAKPAFEALGAAKSLAAASPGSSLVIGFFGSSVDSAAGQVASAGASKICAVAGPDFAEARYASDAAAAEAICKVVGAEVVIAPATSRLSRALPAVAQRLKGAVDTHVTGVSAADGFLTVSRWYYRQRMEAVVKRTRKPWFILLDPGSQPAWQGQTGAAAVEKIPLDLPPECKRTSVTGVRELSVDAQTIRPEAETLLVAGAGWTKKQADGQPHVGDAEKLILGFLKGARASLGSSKSLVDLGGEGQAVLSFLTHLNQIGQTGSTPRHHKGLATCCHGEEPHTVGWRFIDERRAINLDPNCGWARGKADVLYVADAFAVMSKVNEMLSAK
jgi:electron transfer flavoprotein alpha subunit